MDSGPLHMPINPKRIRPDNILTPTRPNFQAARECKEIQSRVCTVVVGYF
jgi:hypothetical protein